MQPLTVPVVGAGEPGEPDELAAEDPPVAVGADPQPDQPPRGRAVRGQLQQPQESGEREPQQLYLRQQRLGAGEGSQRRTDFLPKSGNGRIKNSLIQNL